MNKIINNGDETFKVEYWHNGQLTGAAVYQCVFYVYDGNTKANRVVIVSQDYGIELSFDTTELEIDGVAVTDAADAFAKLKEFVGSGFRGAGGTAETTLSGFEANKPYKAGTAILENGSIWVAIADFTSGASFDADDWERAGVSWDELDDKLDKEKNDDGIWSRFVHDDSGEAGHKVYTSADYMNVAALVRKAATAVKRVVYVIGAFNGVGTRLMHTISKIYYTKNTDGESFTDADEIATIKDVDAVSDTVGDLSGVTNSEDKTSVVSALNSLFKMVKSALGIAVEIKTDGLFISRTANDTTTETRFAELSDLEPLSQEIQGLHGKTARLNGYDFGEGITAENINDADIQTMLTAYALVQLGLSDITEIPNFIGVHNLYAGTDGNHLLVFNQAIIGTGTADNPEFPAHWIDNGIDSVSVATTTTLGVVKSSTTDMEVAVDADGIMTVTGLSTALGNKVDKTDNADKVYGTDKDGEQTTFDRTSFGKVDTVNGIAPDTSKNVQTDYVYETEAEFETDKANIPVGATVIKLYEYPDNIAGFMIVPDYANMETTNRITTNGGTWTADRTGYVKLRAFATNSSGAGYMNIYFYVNGRVVERYEWHNADSNKIFRADIMLPVAAGYVVKIQVSFLEGAAMSYEQYGCWFIPPKFVKKELPVIVEKNGSYSLDEVKTADTWIDGRPIYKKTYKSIFNTSSTIKEYFIDQSFVGDTIRQLIRIEAITYRSDGFVMSLPTPFEKGAQEMYKVYLSPSNGLKLLMQEEPNSTHTHTVYTTIYYIKTTD